MEKQNEGQIINRRTYLQKSNLGNRKGLNDSFEQDKIKKEITSLIKEQLKTNAAQKQNNEKKIHDNESKVEAPKNIENVYKNDNKSIEGNNSTNRVVNKSNSSNKRRTNAVKIMFLGGVGEVGKNMMAVEYGGEIIIIDSGSAFPGDDLPGIDLIVQNIDYLIKNKNKVKAIFITHGHEDHIGSLPYLLSEINVPIYGSRMTCALIEKKLKEHKKIKPILNNVKAGDVIKTSKFSVEFIHVNHSISGSFAFAITTPVGVWLHTGDFKVDYTPIDGKIIDINRFAELGKKGVLLLTADSTNVEHVGFTVSESAVGRTFDNLFAQYRDKRIFVATFASNIYRLQQLINMAEKYKRKIAFSGRSMINVTEVAEKIKEIKINKNLIIQIDKINKYKPEEVLVISTGSQGEPFSALTRMASDSFKGVRLGEDDAVIISSSPIPGNERAIGDVINNLYKTGCVVIYDKLAEIHVSGHAKSEELKLIHALVKPKFFIPAHGEYRMLKKHIDLAVSMGMNEKDTLLPEIGSCVQMTRKSIKFGKSVESGRKLVDGSGFGDLESYVLKDRKTLAEDGLVVVNMVLNFKTGTLYGTPDIVTRGVIYDSESAQISKEAGKYLLNEINNAQITSGDWSEYKNIAKKSMRNFFFRKTKRTPMILAFITGK